MYMFLLIGEVFGKHRGSTQQLEAKFGSFYLAVLILKVPMKKGSSYGSNEG